MKVCVCIKGVPDTSEAEIEVKGSGKSVYIEDSTSEINESDNYALEESIQISEATDGSVQVLSAGADNNEVMMIAGEALAKGAENALLIVDPLYDNIKNDPRMIAKLLASAIKDQSFFDVILTGCIASDDSFTAVGAALAEELQLPHATMVKKVEINDNGLRVHRELEGGLSEVDDLSLPAVLTIQTGINEPRYSSVLAIRKARNKERKIVAFKDIGIEEQNLEKEMRTELAGFYIPEFVSHAEIIEGDVDTKAETLAEKLVSGGII